MSVTLDKSYEKDPSSMSDPLSKNKREHIRGRHPVFLSGCHLHVYFFKHMKTNTSVAYTYMKSHGCINNITLLFVMYIMCVSTDLNFII